VNRVVNTTVISNFAAVGGLDLLHGTAGPLCLPVQVYDEIVAGQMAGYAYYDGIEQHVAPFVADGWLHLVTLTDDELSLFASLPPHLHPAERTCLSIARQRGWGVLSDDRAARRQAFAWNIPLSGTIGVLLLAIRDGRITVAHGNALLREMVGRASYRTPTMDLGELLSPSNQILGF
jgi:predicted nucleic acid-binding protein